MRTADMTTWATAPIAFYSVPRCPYCGSVGRITVRSTREADGSTTRRTVCKACSQRYVLVLEVNDVPDSGRDPEPVFYHHH